MNERPKIIKLVRMDQRDLGIYKCNRTRTAHVDVDVDERPTLVPLYIRSKRQRPRVFERNVYMYARQCHCWRSAYFRVHACLNPWIL